MKAHRTRITATPIYAGDGVYARLEEGDLILTTGSHEDYAAEARIVLEPGVLDIILRYLTDQGLVEEDR